MIAENGNDEGTEEDGRLHVFFSFDNKRRLPRICH